jgi:threonine/homoserine/homoserine lactone efflux protein
MFAIHNYTGFITAILLFQMVPGPGTLAILHATARGGVGAGMGAVAGTLAGDLVYMVAAVSGLAALLAANPALFSVVQWAGIAYLCRFGWGLLRGAASSDPGGATPDGGAWCSFRRAFAVGLSNPKVIMFFMALFPLFMSYATRPATLVVMMAHVTLICLLYQTCLVLVGKRTVRLFARKRRLRRVATRLSGAALIGFGVKLALDNR